MVFSRILVPLDGSRIAESSLEHAGRMGRLFSGRVTLLQVLDTERGDDRKATDSVDWRLRKAEAERYLESISEDVRLAGVEVDTELTEGCPAELISDFINRNRIDLLVMSAWGAGGGVGFPLGGTANKVLPRIGISCLMIREPSGTTRAEEGGYRRVLVPLDGTRSAELAVFVASALDPDGRAEIVLLHVICPPAMPRRGPLTESERSLSDQVVECNRRVASQYLDDLRNQLGDSHQVRVRLEIAPSPPRRIIQACREEAPDLMILTAHNGDDPDSWRSDFILQTLLQSVSLPLLILQGDLQLAEFPAGRTN
ncbi:MAG: universal stress protein [Wenzhouxiangella sp.]